jgi:hypothetical protein
MNVQRLLALPNIKLITPLAQTKLEETDFTAKELAALNKNELTIDAVKTFSQPNLLKIFKRYPSKDCVERNYQFCKDIVNQAKNAQSTFKKLPYLKFKKFLQKKENKTWFVKRLLCPSTNEEIEKWSAGKHEWLERHFIEEVIDRSAGECPQIKANVEGLDWLDIQFGLRSPVNSLFHGENSIDSGHTPAVRKEQPAEKPYKALTGACTDQSHEFHVALDTAFKVSTNPCTYVKKAHRIYQNRCNTMKKELQASPNKNVISTGHLTSDTQAINQARHLRLVRDRFHENALQFQHFKAATRQDQDGDEVESVVSTITQDAAGQPSRAFTITGDQVTAKTNGYVRVFYQNNDQYFGEMVKGKKHGYGKLIEANGDKYYGYWKNDLRNGNGIQIKNQIKTRAIWENGSKLA